jgi:ABC-2 type transport system ATP-binding protein
MSGEGLMDYWADFFADFDRSKAADMMARLGLREEQRVSQMSKGMKEKVQLILVMSRRAKLYLLDEPIGGVDPATRDYILDTIIRNYSEDASVVISTHLISDVENVLDDVIFLREGKVSLQASVDDLREQYGKSVDALFREVFKC